MAPITTPGGDCGLSNLRAKYPAGKFSKKNPFPLCRDGTGDRDYVHVMDLAEGHVRAVGHILGEGRQGVHVFNLGTGTGATVMEVSTSIIISTSTSPVAQVIAAFALASGREIPHVVAPRRKGDVDSLYASCQVGAPAPSTPRRWRRRCWGGGAGGAWRRCAGTCGGGRPRTPGGSLGGLPPRGPVAGGCNLLGGQWLGGWVTWPTRF